MYEVLPKCWYLVDHMGTCSACGLHFEGALHFSLIIIATGRKVQKQIESYSQALYLL